MALPNYEKQLNKIDTPDDLQTYQISMGDIYIETGRTYCTAGSGSPTANEVTFSNEFESTPIVFTNPLTGSPGTVVIGVCASSTTTTGFTIYFTRTGTTSSYVTWMAIGKKKQA